MLRAIVPSPWAALHEALPLVDLRTHAAMTLIRIRGALALPAADFADRSLELPPRGVVLRVMYASDDGASVEVAARLAWDVACWYDGAIASPFWGTVPPAAVARGSPVDLREAPMLWRPAPIIADFIALVLRPPAPPPCLAAPAAGAAASPADAGGSVAVADDVAGDVAAAATAATVAVAGGSEAATACAAAAPAAELAPFWVLDAGCGTGRNAAGLAMADPRVRVLGIDNRRAMIEKLRKFIAREPVASRGGARIVAMECDIMAWLLAAARRGDGSGSSSIVSVSAAPGAAAASDAAGGDAAAPLAIPPLFDAVMCLRFTHKPFFAQLLHVLAATGPLLRDAGGGTAGSGSADGSEERISWVAIESFHISSSHPTDPQQLLREGEAVALVSEALATLPPPTAARIAIDPVMERIVMTDDGRPLLCVILRVARRPLAGDVGAS